VMELTGLGTILDFAIKHYYLLNKKSVLKEKKKMTKTKEKQ